MLALGKISLMGENKKFRLQQPQNIDTIQAEPPFFLRIQEDKRGLCLQGDTFGEWMKNVTHHK